MDSKNILSSAKTEENFFTPEALIQVVKNNLSPTFREVFYPVKVRGKLIENKPRPAGGYCFLDVKGESGAKVVIKLPVSLYEKTIASLPSGSTLIFEGIPSVEWSYYKSAFEVLITVNRIINYDVEELLPGMDKTNLQEILSKKTKRSTKIKVNERLKNILKSGKKPKIVLITGTTSIADEDVKTSAGYALQFYDVVLSRVNILSPEEINAELKKWIDSDIDAIAIVRGGGEGLDVFNDFSLCLTALDSEKPVIAALGHSTDSSYFDLFGADISFPVPASFGKFLKEVYEELVTEMELKKTHAELNSIINQKEMQIRSLETRIKELEKARKNLLESNYVLKILLIVALIIIVLLFFR